MESITRLLAVSASGTFYNSGEHEGCDEQIEYPSNLFTQRQICDLKMNDG